MTPFSTVAHSKNSYSVFHGTDGLKGVKNSRGEIVVTPRYEEIKYHTIDDELDTFKAIATKGSKDYLICEEGKAVFEADELRPNSGSICPAIFRTEGKWGVVNRRGEVEIEPLYDSIYPDANGFLFTELGGKEGFIFMPYEDVIEPIFERVAIDEDDYIEVVLNGVKGYVDELGEFTEYRDCAYYNMNLIFNIEI